MCDRALMKTEKESALSSTFGVTGQCTNTHTHIPRPPSAISLSLLWRQCPRVCKALQQWKWAGRRVAEAALMKGDLTKLPPGLRRGRCSSCPVRRDPQGGIKRESQSRFVHPKEKPRQFSVARGKKPRRRQPVFMIKD